ncbi:hypothetical protein ACFWA6_02090 [Streptomyces sp. NPDC060020]|uniref:hypothetical protein n=1 Tax=Streptomyces sp. NPDC060020 TaxID=3347038 RepID=UPI0036785941
MQPAYGTAPTPTPPPAGLAPDAWSLAAQIAQITRIARIAQDAACAHPPPRRPGLRRPGLRRPGLRRPGLHRPVSTAGVRDAVNARLPVQLTLLLVRLALIARPSRSACDRPARTDTESRYPPGCGR